MARETNKIATGMRNVGAGFKMVGGGNTPSYQLMFITASQLHPANSTQTIVVPYVDLGRSSDCAVRFGEDLPMVSRKHAVIEQRNGEVVLINLSTTNQTLINGRPVNKEWHLSDGDELQLSASGPRIQFLASTTKTSAIGVSKRIKLLAQQSLRPYRYIILALLLVLVIGGGLLGYALYQNKRKLDAQEQITKQLEEKNALLAQGDSVRVQQMDTQAKALAEANKTNAELQEKMAAQLAKLTIKPPAPSSPPPVPAKTNMAPLMAEMVEAAKRNVYYIELRDLEVEIGGVVKKVDKLCSCTGFLLSDGTFLTARHCIEPWMYSMDDDMLQLNAHINNGAKLAYKVVAVSPVTKDRIELNYLDFVTPDDKELIGYIDEGKNLPAFSAGNENDWAYAKTKKVSDLLPFDISLSSHLKSSTELHVLGFTYAGRAQDTSDPSNYRALYSKMNVAQDGLVGGYVQVTNTGFDMGNSGGPVFIVKDYQMVVVGIVSAQMGEFGEALKVGIITPLSAVKKL